MPPQALALAFTASIYPPAVAAVIALGKGAQLRSRVFAFVLAAAVTTYATGCLMLLLLEELGATSSQSHSASAGIDLALGVLLILLAIRLRTKRPDPPAASGKPSANSKIERYLTSRKLAFVLGMTLYILPSPIYIGAVKAIADAKLSTSNELLDLAATVAVMLWLIEVPMLMLIIVPGRSERALEEINLWFGRNGRLVAVLASAAAGAYLIVKALIALT
jgi:hypothetical protein